MVAMILAAALALVMMGVAHGQVQPTCVTSGISPTEICQEACGCLCKNNAARAICVGVCQIAVINNTQQCRNYPMTDLCGDTFAPQCSTTQTQSFCGKGCECCGYGANNQTCIDQCKQGTWALVAKSLCPVAEVLEQSCTLNILLNEVICVISGPAVENILG